MKKKRKSMGQIFVRDFLKSLLYVSVFVSLVFGSYQVSLAYFERYGNAGENKSLSKYIDNLNADGVAEEVSKNMILAIDPESGKIKKIVIEICNTNTGNIDYITVPSNLQFTISYDLYKKLATANSDIPQIITMRKIHKYFEGEGLCQCAQLLLEDTMDIQFSYYTVIPYSVYKQMFRTVKASGVQKWRKEYKNEMKSLSSEADYEGFFKKYYTKVESNLTEQDKCKYSSTYLQAVPKQVAFSIVSGERSDDGFVLSVEETNYFIYKILSNEAYKGKEATASSGSGTITSSVGLNLEILNSTTVNGLASSYQEKLIAKGMNVTSIGNYSKETLQQTKIIVTEEGYGQDLLAYFPDAQIEVGQCKDGVDICIVLGLNDSQM